MNVIITGASQGFGSSIAEKFLKEGANISICGRDEQQLAERLASLKQTYKSKIIGYSCDVSKEYQVKTFIDKSIEELQTIDAIVLNAGIYGPMGPIESVDFDAFKYALEVNLYGVVLPCKYIVPHFKQNNCGKIIMISGGGATTPMPYITGYAASKAASIRFMESISLELKSFNIDVNAVAPGALATRLVDSVLNAGPELIGKEFYEKNLKWKNEGATSPELGANLVWFLANYHSDKITGKLISAQWDDWKNLPLHLKELNSSDIYCLRRIVPEDRNKNWN
jgi:3-oxoacyl-[acyl-carrier protein] reductase